MRGYRLSLWQPPTLFVGCGARVKESRKQVTWIAYSLAGKELEVVSRNATKKHPARTTYLFCDEQTSTGVIVPDVDFNDCKDRFGVVILSETTMKTDTYYQT